MDYLYLQPRRRNKPLFYLWVATAVVFLMPLFPFAGGGGGGGGGSQPAVAADSAMHDQQAPAAPRPARDS